MTVGSLPGEPGRGGDTGRGGSVAQSSVEGFFLGPGVPARGQVSLAHPSTIQVMCPCDPFGSGLQTLASHHPHPLPPGPATTATSSPV